ncbi:hypothetical protein JCM10213_006934 [Rhodosporidiobolus nylandii]
MYQQPYDPNAYAAAAYANQQPRPSSSSAAYPPRQQPAPNMAAFANGAYGQPQQNGMMNPQAMYGQTQGGGAGQPQQYSNFASASAFGTPGGAQPAYPGAPAAPSTASIFQQQLAAQQAMQGQGSPAPPAQSQPPLATAYQNQQQAYQQLYARQVQQQSQAQAQARSSTPSQQHQSLPFHPPQISAPAAAPTPATPLIQPRPPTAGASALNSNLPAEVAAITRLFPNGSITPDRFNQLTLQQQSTLRQYMMQQRQAQQAQLGLGMPSSPATASGSGANTPSKPPAPAMALAAGAAQGAAKPAGTIYTALTDFYARQGKPFPGSPTVEGVQLDLTRMLAVGSKAGGYEAITARNWWGSLASVLGFQAASPNDHPRERLQAIQVAYRDILHPFEQHWMQSHRSTPVATSRPPTAGGAAGSPAAMPNGVPTPAAAPSPAPAPASAPPLPPQQQPATLDLTASASPSPFATGATPRPTTATSQREGTMPPSSSAGGAQPFAGSAADVKGKGKAVEYGFVAVKTEPGLADGASPATLPSSTPKTATAPLPDASTSASASSPAKPSEPLAPPRRKRRKIEYTPLTRPVDTHGGCDLPLAEQTILRAEKARRPRNLHDLGTVDIHSLTMSLRCRLPAEVAYALNALGLIAQSIQLEPNDGGVPFPLERCGDLLEELLELLEEMAFGTGDEDGEEGEPAREEEVERPPFEPPRSYRDLFRLVTEEAGKLAPPPQPERARFEPLPGSDTVLAILNLLRNVSRAPENANLFGRQRRVLDVLARVSALPLQQERRSTARYPLPVTPAESLAIKKDVLEVLNTFGLDVRLAEHDEAAQRGVVDLLLFFLRDAEQQGEQLFFDLTSTPSLASRLPQPTSLAIPPYLELGLSALARVALLDANRAVLARLLPPDDLFSLFSSLVHRLPVTEQDFQLCTFEAGLVHVYHTCLALYNLAFLAPLPVKRRLRDEPRFAKALMRVVKRLAGSAHPERGGEDLFVALAQRCVGTLALLNNLGGLSSTSSASSEPASEVPWWGLSMSGSPSSPTSGADDAGVRGRGLLLRPPLPPGAASAPAVAADGEPPILAGEARTLWELLAQGSLGTVFGGLVGMMDATRGRKRKRVGVGEGGE